MVGEREGIPSGIWGGKSGKVQYKHYREREKEDEVKTTENFGKETAKINKKGTHLMKRNVSPKQQHVHWNIRNDQYNCNLLKESNRNKIHHVPVEP